MEELENMNAEEIAEEIMASLGMLNTSPATIEYIDDDAIEEEAAVEHPIEWYNMKLDGGFYPEGYPERFEEVIALINKEEYYVVNMRNMTTSSRKSSFGAWKIKVANVLDSSTKETFYVNNYWANRFSETLPVREKVLAEHQEIPSNSGSLLVRESTSRFSDAIWYDEIQEKEVIIAGVGGIGSYVAFLLSRMRPERLIIYDDDIVEAANMSGQLYRTGDINQHKVDAISNMMYSYSNYSNVISLRSKYTEDSHISDIMICGFDNMEARRVFFSNWLRRVSTLPLEDRAKCLFIDGRLAAEELQVLAIQGDDEYSIDKYQKDWLFSDAEADATVCSYKQTTFMANMIASIMVNIFVNFVSNQCDPILPRDVPFFTSYAADTMYFKVEI